MKIKGTTWTDDEILDVLRRLESESVSAVARSLGLDPRSIRRVRDGRRAAELRPAPREPTTRQTMPSAPNPPRIGGVSMRPQPTATSDMHRRLADLCRRGPQSLEQLCDALDLSPARCRQLVADAQAAGYSVEAAGGSYALRTPDDAPSGSASTTVRAVTGDRFLLGVCSDLHFGSKYCMRDQLRDYADAAYALGVRTMVVAGDLLDGCYKHGMWELSHHGWDEQARDAFESLPQFDGLNWYAIDGNHDETFWASSGAVSGQRLEDYFRNRGRSDLHWIGQRAGTLSIRCGTIARPVKVELWHPRPNRAYALSYQLQKRVEAYAPGCKPDVVVGGHWHAAAYFECRGVHALAAPCFQSPESSFARSLVGGVSCGAWVLGWQMTRDGTMRRVSAERWAYYHREESRTVDVEPAA